MSQMTVTKSIRLSPTEAQELLHLSTQRASSEAALMKKWIQEGIQAEKLELAIQAYMKDETDLRGGATMAGVTYNRFMRELQARKIVIFKDEQFLDSLDLMADLFDSPSLREAVRQVKTEQNKSELQ